MQDNGPPQIEARSGAGHVARGPGAKLLAEQGVHVAGQNAARCELLAISRFGQVRFARQPLAGALNRLFERQVFERVQCVVVNKNADGALRRQQMCQPIDHVRQRMFGRMGIVRQRAAATSRSIWCRREPSNRNRS